MAVCGISISLNKQSHPGTLPSLSTLKKPIQLLSSSSSSASSSDAVRWRERLGGSLGRRMFKLSIFGFLSSWDLAFSRLSFYSEALASPLLELDRYTDSKDGFTLLVPSSWIKVDKAGATVLFEDSKDKTNNVGVVVSPTRISSLGEFGTPEFVADKLIQAERRKESTKEAEVISVSERVGHAGLQVYEFEYKVDSTRGGMKRVFSAAFATSKKLYLLNITHSDRLDNPLEMKKRMILEQVLHSFNAIPST
ncbi:psbP domain-containing protein 2, chloroplastic isoform X1 [Primulina huaijiensis]|uniref:psbP domain-containing protein 2, chloroplastic isoform X1 n=1 Tax=Primulina huaijiensis TaxID=1492673 RepID=UPI003CC7507B